MASVANRETASATLYEVVASEITRLIDRGTFRPGDRLPSVRRLSEQQAVSISTVLEAYRLLEDNGLVEARPQSGYFVRSRPAAPLPAPDEVARPSSTAVTMSEHVLRMVRLIADPRYVPLGAAVPNPALLPVHRLTRILGAVSRSAGARGLAYESPRGAPELRGQIAQRMLSAGCGLTPDDVLVTDGCTEALGLALRVVCQPGDTVAIESPTYFGLLEILRSLGLRALPLPSHPETSVHLDTLRFALSQMPIKACLLQTTFSNPLGSCMPDKAKEVLVALLAERDLPLIEDDIYGDLSFRASRPRAAKAFDRTGGVILCSSFSKTVSPGYRIGWIAAGRYQPAVERLKMVNTLASATLPQLTLAEFLARGGYDHHLRRMRREYAQNRTCMVQAVNQYFPAGTRTSQPEGGQVLWVELPRSVDAMALAERALAHEIALAPGPMFSASGEYGHHVRLNFATWSPRVEHALLALGRLATELMDEGAGETRGGRTP